jgi:hypothetical protein
MIKRCLPVAPYMCLKVIILLIMNECLQMVHLMVMAGSYAHTKKLKTVQSRLI